MWECGNVGMWKSKDVRMWGCAHIRTFLLPYVWIYARKWEFLVWICDKKSAHISRRKHQ